MRHNTTETTPAWEREVESLLPLFGHRNWIVVADSAYPAQSRPGIETLVADVDQLAAVRKVFDAITESRHVRAKVYVDYELAFVDDGDAPGVAEYRKQLGNVLYGSVFTALPHEEIIGKLDQAAQHFRILIIKTEMTIPYTSVFFELDCGYWDAEAEQRLRQTIGVSVPK